MLNTKCSCNTNPPYPLGNNCTVVTIDNFPTHLNVSSLSINQNMTVNGNIEFPQGIEFSSVLSNPGIVPQNTMWVSSNTNNIYFGNNSINFQPISSINQGPNILVNSLTQSSFNVELNSNVSLSSINIETSTVAQRIISNSLEPYPLSIYVSQSGSDITGTGSKSNPYSTIQKAITFSETLTTAQDSINIPTVYIGQGFYNESLLITKSINLVGNTFLLNNLSNYIGFGTRIGSNATIVNISSSQQNHIVSFQFLDFRCPISNSESQPIYPLSLYMLYSNMNQNSSKPNLYISGVSNTQRTTFFASNTRSNGTGRALPGYFFSSFTDVYLEECRWNATSEKSMIQTNGSFNVNRCELILLGQISTISTVPLILQETTSGDPGFIKINDSNLSITYTAVKGIGTNIITVSPLTTIPNGQITLSDCNTNIVNSIVSNFIVQNLSPIIYTLNLAQQNSMNPNNNSIFDPTNLNIINNNIIAPSSIYTSNIDLNSNNLLNCSTIESPLDIFFRKSTTGNIIFNNLPTSPPSEVGAIWTSSNVLRIV